MANVSSSNGIEKYPKLRFPNYTEPYKLMEFSKYADVNPKCGKVPNSFYYIDLECVNAGEIKDLRIEMAETAPSRAQRLLTLYDILFQTVRPYQKNNYHFKVENDLPTVASTGYAVFRTEQSSEYLYELIHTERFLSDIMKRCTGTSFPAVSSSDIEDIAIWIPGFQEQKKIGDFLTLVDTKIAKQRLLIEHLKKYKRGVVKTLLDPKQNQRKGVIWTTDTIGKLGTFIKGAALSKADISDFGTPFVLYGELYTTYKEVVRSIARTTQASVDDVYFSKVGDVVIPTSGETPEEISTASCIMVPNVILAGDLNIYRSTIVDGRIMSYLLNHIVNAQIARVAQGKSVVHVQASEVGKISITYPDHNEQERIAQILELIDNRIAVSEKALISMQMMKKAFLQQLFI